MCELNYGQEIHELSDKYFKGKIKARKLPFELKCLISYINLYSFAEIRSEFAVPSSQIDLLGIRTRREKKKEISEFWIFEIKTNSTKALKQLKVQKDGIEQYCFIKGIKKYEIVLCRINLNVNRFSCETHISVKEK